MLASSFLHWKTANGWQYGPVSNEQTISQSTSYVRMAKSHLVEVAGKAAVFHDYND